MDILQQSGMQENVGKMKWTNTEVWFSSNVGDDVYMLRLKGIPLIGVNSREWNNWFKQILPSCK